MALRCNDTKNLFMGLFVIGLSLVNCSNFLFFFFKLCCLFSNHYSKSFKMYFDYKSFT